MHDVQYIYYCTSKASVSLHIKEEVRVCVAWCPDAPQCQHPNFPTHLCCWLAGTTNMYGSYLAWHVHAWLAANKILEQHACTQYACCMCYWACMHKLQQYIMVHESCCLLLLLHECCCLLLSVVCCCCCCCLLAACPQDPAFMDWMWTLWSTLSSCT